MEERVLRHAAFWETLIIRQAELEQHVERAPGRRA
jgi:hypothetical protein